MSAQVSVAQAKAGFAALVARAEAGEQIVVTRNGRPVACLGPLPATKPVVFGDLRGLWVSDDLSLPEEILNDFEDSADNFVKQLKEYEKDDKSG
ncbi:MAG TPA: type II toxin-antitoxin system prevent-host-death family antitoxin [Stellaceae bacterium]|nr:type II toxin-antitoxin system prevent-host-death family antitoxin [Stellaceae bacterium]